MHFPFLSTSALRSGFCLHRVVWALLVSILLPASSHGIEPIWGRGDSGIFKLVGSDPIAAPGIFTSSR